MHFFINFDSLFIIKSLLLSFFKIFMIITSNNYFYVFNLEIYKIMEDNFDIFELKKNFLTCTPLEKIKFPKKITAERQKLILDEIITDCLVQKYPVKNNYRRNFLRLLIERLENDNEEINDELYEFFCSYLSAVDSPMHYRHFLINSNQRVIIKESKSIISDGTTGLCSWQVKLIYNFY